MLYCRLMTLKLYKAAEVCEMTQLQPYVLRSWEKEFPGIGVRKSEDSPRLYRQSDVEQVLRIKQLVFGEGLTLAGARRKLEESGSSGSGQDADIGDVLETLGADARARIAHVREGLRSILTLLASSPGQGLRDEYRLQPPDAVSDRRKPRMLPARRETATSRGTGRGRRKGASA
jgi:DNA-binding transcriptional MerR regulator